MTKLAFAAAAALLGALAATGAKAGEYGYGYGPRTTYTYSETRFGGGYRDVDFDDDDVPAYRRRRVVREVYDRPHRPYSWGGPQFRGYAWTGPHYRNVDIDDED